MSRRLDFESARSPATSHDLPPPARLPAAVQVVAGRLVAARDRLAAGGDRHHVPHPRGDQRAAGGRHARRPVADRRARPRHRPHEVGADAGAAADRRQAGARRRVRHAQRALREARPPVVRLLRPQPDRPAHVTRDGRPAGGPLLPRLRADLLLPAHRHGRRRDVGAVRRQLEAGLRRPLDHAGADRAGVPLQPRVAPDPARGAAEDGGRRDGVRGEHRRRPRREVVRPGGPGAGAVRGVVGGGLPPDGEGEQAALDLRADDGLPALARAGGGAARRRSHGRLGVALPWRVHPVQRARADARHAAPDARACGSARHSGRRRRASGSSR